MSAICIDCGMDTTPGGEHAAMGTWEWYVVRDEVWVAAGLREADTEVSTFSSPGILCIGCLEERIGRELVPEDFEWGILCNTSFPALDTPRLAARKGLS